MLDHQAMYRTAYEYIRAGGEEWWWLAGAALAAERNSVDAHSGVPAARVVERGMRLMAAKRIMHEAIRRSGGRGVLAKLLIARRRVEARGDVVAVQSIDRTIEDLGAHWIDGKFIGGPQIAAANDVTQEPAMKHDYIWLPDRYWVPGPRK